MSESCSFEKKIGKTSENCYIWAHLPHKNGVRMGHTQNEKQFFNSEITKTYYNA